MMDIEAAKLLLFDYIIDDADLATHQPGQVRGLEYLHWNQGDNTATLDGEFTADQLEAIAIWMREKTLEISE
jgi:hypothetical protein